MTARARLAAAFLAPSRRTLAGVLILVVVVVAVLTFAIHDAKARILQALGPRATAGSIELSFPNVVLNDLRIAADPAAAWPAPDEFRARRVEVRVDIGSLWAFRHGAPLRIADVHVQDGSLAMLRTRGHLTMLPALRDAARARAATLPADDAIEPGTASHPTSLLVARARVEGLTVDLYDATLPGAGATPRLHFEQVHGEARQVALPLLGQPITLALDGILKGVEHDGAVSVAGTFTPARHEGDLRVSGNGVDLIPLQPWMQRYGPATVRHGRLDLRLDARVSAREIVAPGKLVLTDFSVEGGGVLAAARRRAVVAALSRDGRIELGFTLRGRTDDPRLVLDESLAAQVTTGLAGAVGGEIKGLADSAANLFGGLFGGR